MSKEFRVKLRKKPKEKQMNEVGVLAGAWKYMFDLPTVKEREVRYWAFGVNAVEFDPNILYSCGIYCEWQTDNIIYWESILFRRVGDEYTGKVEAKLFRSSFDDMDEEFKERLRTDAKKRFERMNEYEKKSFIKLFTEPLEKIKSLLPKNMQDALESEQNRKIK